MTMDYRSNRVTVTIDPTSKKLLKQHVVNSLIKINLSSNKKACQKTGFLDNQINC